ncbi:MAG: ABC transporter substrate-binding protein, partial [Anaerolineae bacterium]
MTDLLQPRPQRSAPKHPWLWILLVVFVAGCLILACAAGGLAWLISSGRISLGGRTPVAATPGASPVATQPSRGTALDLRLMADPPTTLDPAMVEDSASAEYVDKIYSGLVGLDADLNVVPEIAERWDISADGTVYTFHLRDNVYFHNGRKATAQDFKYSI